MINKSKILKDAQKFIAKAQWDKAIGEYLKIVQESPNDANTHNTIGDLYLKRNDNEKAIESFRTAADIFNKSGFTLKAIALYKKVLNIKPDQVDIMLLTGKLNAERGLLGNANESYLAAASYFTKQGQRVRAIDIYKTLCDLNPANLSLAQKLGELYLSEGFEREGVSKFIELAERKAQQDELEDAQIFLDKAAKKGADRFDYTRVSALVDLKSNRLPEALLKLEEIKAIDPNDTRVLSLLAEAYRRSGRYEESQDLYKTLVEKEPGNRPYRLQLINVYMKSGDYSSALNEYRALVDGHIQKGELGEAERLISEFLEQKPDSAEALQLLADIYAKEGREEETLSIQKRIAEAYASAGDTAKAANIYSKLLDKSPEDAALKGALGSLRVEGTEKPSVPVETAETAKTGPEPETVPEMDKGTAELEEFLPDETLFEETGDEGPAGLDEILDIPDEPEAADEDGGGADMYELPEITDGLPPLDLGEDEQFPEPVDGGPKVLELPDEDLAGLEEFLEAPDETAPPQSLEESLSEVDVFIRYGLTSKAVSALSSLEKDFPQNPEVLKRRLEVCKSLGDLDGFVGVSIELAALYEGLDMPDESVKVLKKAYSMEPENEQLRELLGGPAPSAAPAPEDTSAGVPEAPDEFPSEEDHIFQVPDGSVFEHAESAPSMSPGSVHYFEELAEADFYAQQGLYDEARKIYKSLLSVNPDDLELNSKYEAVVSSSAQAEEAPEIILTPVDDAPEEAGESRLDNELESMFRELELEDALPGEAAEFASEAAAGTWAKPDARLAPAPEAAPREAAPEKEQEEREDTGFFDLGAELREELEDAGPTAAPADNGMFEDRHLEEVFQEFKRGVEEQLNKEDYETHYNLGIAYKEMGMLEEALNEFELAAKDPGRRLDCASMQGLCRLELGEYDKAIAYFEMGLEVPGRDKGEYMGLKYDLATAYELKGDVASAQAVINELHSEDADFRDVRDRLHRLNRQMLETGTPPASKPGKKDDQGTPDKPKKSRVSYL